MVTQTVPIVSHITLSHSKCYVNYCFTIAYNNTLVIHSYLLYLHRFFGYYLYT